MDDREQAVALAEAAAHLGLSVIAVKKRLQRGQLRGLKVDGRWTAVYLAGPDTSTDGGPVLDSPDSARTTAVQAAPELVAAIQAYEKLVTAQQAEIAFLREQVAALVQRVPAIAEAATTPAPDASELAVQPVQASPPAAQVRRPWWAFWRPASAG